jgi:hypothetical protein
MLWSGRDEVIGSLRITDGDIHNLGGMPNRGDLHAARDDPSVHDFQSIRRLAFLQFIGPSLETNATCRLQGAEYGMPVELHVVTEHLHYIRRFRESVVRFVEGPVSVSQLADIYAREQVRRAILANTVQVTSIGELAPHSDLLEGRRNPLAGTRGKHSHVRRGRQ